MNKVLFVILSIFSVAHAQRATVTLLQPRMYAATNTKSECIVKDLSDANDLKLDNCPGGATCVEGSTTGKGRCTVFTLAEHQGATAFDYTASRVIRAETQLATSGAGLSCDLSNVAGMSDNNQKWRCIEHAVHLFLGDDESISDYQSSCSVSYEGNIGSKMTSGNLGNSGMDSATLSSGFASSSTDKKLSCHYVPQNNLYLGYGYAQVTFTKKSSALALGEKEAKIIKVPMRFVPGNAVDAGDVLDSTTSAADPDLTSAHNEISMATASDGITGSTSSGGELQLSYRVNVMDKRYKVADQSGVEVLNQAAGNFNLIKEGLEIHADYSTFYNAAENDFLNAGVGATPLDYSAYKTGNCTKRGQSAGDSLASTGCQHAEGYYDRDFAQYQLSGTYKAKYGGMEHWKKGYIGCQLCSNRLAIQGFATQSGGAQIDVALDIDVTSLNSGCTADATTTCITLDNIFADPVGDGVEDGKALRLPNCDSNGISGNNCGSTGGYDPQHASGHVLGEFFTPKLEGTTSYGDYDSDFDFLSGNRLVVTDDTKFLNSSSNSGLEIAAECASAGQGKVYTMSADMLAAANDLFYNKCRIVVKDIDFAKKSNIVFFKSQNDKTGCDTAACSNAVYAEITQVDGRRILVGDAELSLLRRKLATVEKAGAAITMSIAKYTESATQVLRFDIVGTNTMMGYNANTEKCTTNLVSTDEDCTEVAIDSELEFISSSINGARKEHTIRSSPSCTGFLDVQFKDQNDTFAVYDLRIPCSRTTASAMDEVTLTYDFTFGYDLTTNVVTAKAYYLSDMSSYNHTNLNVGNANSGLKQDLLVSVSYGQCSSTNTILRNNESGAFHGCEASSNANGKWADQSGSNFFQSTGLTLNEWSHCAQKVEDISGSNSYIVTTKIAMNYQRKLKYTSSSGSTISTNNFCADRVFVTTIKRDATATVTVATLRAPTLERAVTVTDIAWIACSGTNSFKLEISISSSQKDTTSGNAAWSPSNLKKVLKPTSSSSSDSDSLMINVGTMTAGAPTHAFKLESSCITVSAADCDERCDADGDNCEAQSLATSTADSAYSQLTHTATDLVLRGEFTNSDVDSDVNIVTKYVECPLDEANENTGYVRAGATMDCDSAIANAASPTVDGDTDCTQAYTTDKGQADVKLYLVSPANDANATQLLLATEAAAASNQNWQIRHSSIYIERFEKNFDGTEGSLLSSEEFCECGEKAVQYNSSTECVEKADRVFGLIPFGTLECGRNISTTADVSVAYDRIRFNFLPLADATNDIFKVKFVLLAENTDLDEATARRRMLRSITVRKTLKSSASVSASAGGLQVVQPSYNTADDAPAAPPASGNKEPTDFDGKDDDLDPATGDPMTNPDHTHGGEYTLAIIGGIVALVLIIVVIVMVIRQQTSGGSSSGSVGGGANEGGFKAAVGFREQRFSNLRY